MHAEENAILYAVKNGDKLEGATLYTTLSPCLACARLIFSAGIKHVFFQHSYAEYKGLPSDEGVDFLNKFGVKTEKFTADWSQILIDYFDFADSKKIILIRKSTKSAVQSWKSHKFV